MKLIELERLLANGRQEIGTVSLRNIDAQFYDTAVFTVFDERLVSAVYKVGGENGQIVASIRLSYDAAGLLQSVERLDVPPL